MFSVSYRTAMVLWHSGGRNPHADSDTGAKSLKSVAMLGEKWKTCVRKRPGTHWWNQLVATIVSHGRVKTIEWECLSFCKARLNSASNEFSQGTSLKKSNISKPSVKIKVSLRLKFQYPTEEEQVSCILEL